MKKLIEQVRKIVEKDWGKKCKDFCFGCATCWAHQTLENIENMYKEDWKIKTIKKIKNEKKK